MTIPPYPQPGWSQRHDSPFSDVGPFGEDLYDGTDGWDDEGDPEAIDAQEARVEA